MDFHQGVDCTRILVNMRGGPAVSEVCKVGFDFLKRSAIGEAPKVLLNGYILDDAGITGDKFEETVMMEVMRITPKLQSAVINGHLKDRVNVGNWIMEQKDVMPRHNARILDAVSKKNIVDFGVASECKAKSHSDFVSLSVSERTECLAVNMKYLRKTDEDSTAVLTLWVIADLDTAQGRQFLHNALQRLNVSKRMRVGDLSATYLLCSTDFVYWMGFKMR
ncbi:hypothetical protein Y032_0168g187 [Ancylostoma ceylanicum]|uniref:Uncharacterized protein n=1 Tax=Ancylostoma ceylanicum TaxID=53326 RepID=A0A016SWC4_9BILA|nr:hypothetical protein Y032_0168g187 [Ancylostoma ceylanicum]